MIVKHITRGATLFIEVVFYDENDAVVTPSGATLRLAYTVDGERDTAEVVMTDVGGGSWTAQWDTTPADAGPLFYWVQSADSPKSALQGRVMIDANPANPGSVI